MDAYQKEQAMVRIEKLGRELANAINEREQAKRQLAEAQARIAALESDAQGTPLGRLGAVCKFAERELGHSPYSSWGAEGVICEWVLNAKARIAALEKALAEAQADRDVWKHTAEIRYESNLMLDENKVTQHNLQWLNREYQKLETENGRLVGTLKSIRSRFGTGVCKLCHSCSIDKQVALQEIDAALRLTVGEDGHAGS